MDLGDRVTDDGRMRSRVRSDRVPTLVRLLRMSQVVYFAALSLFRSFRCAVVPGTTLSAWLGHKQVEKMVMGQVTSPGRPDEGNCCAWAGPKEGRGRQASCGVHNQRPR